jgi:hypothetical protein
MTDETKTEPQTPEQTEPKKPEPQEPKKLTDLAEPLPKEKDDFENDGKMVSTREEPQEPKKTEVEKPEGIPEHLWDKEKGELITDKAVEELNKQTKMASDFRKKISKGLKADLPEKAEDYVFEPNKEIADFKIGEDEEGKKTLETAKQAAFKSGIGQTQFNDFVNNYFKNLSDLGIIEKPLSEAEAKIASDKFRSEQKAKLGDNAERIINGTVHWIEQNHQQGFFSEAERDILKSFADKGANNILILDKLRKMTGEPEIPLSNVKIEGLPSDEEIKRKFDNDEYTEEEFDKVMADRIKAGRPKNLPA